VRPRTQVQSTQTFTPPDQDAPKPNATFRSDKNLPSSEWRNKLRNRNNPPVVTSQPPQSSTTTVQTDTSTRNRDWRNRTNNNPNWQNNNNRNWQNNTSGNFTFEQARRRHHRDRHDRSWWRSRYNRIALFGGGYYYWDNNYWYPAYGYDPYYSTYTYDEPIYGYNNLEPGQVIASVQTALQEQGYYDDAVDGLIGPRTRAALSNFQRDHGLPITAAIDGPTLRALGLY
jgi:putative peptidoglycan binding protein